MLFDPRNGCYHTYFTGSNKISNRASSPDSQKIGSSLRNYLLLINEKEKQYLTGGIELHSENQPDSTEYDFTYDVSAETWLFTIAESKVSNKKQYSIDILLSDSHALILKTKNIQLTSFSENPNSLVALWKYLEKKLKILAHKDDLIQLFGYYQYRQKSNFIFTFNNKSLANSTYWDTAKKITEGLAVGTPLHLNEISDVFQLQHGAFLNTIKDLKAIGYEIRNHNTNPQLDVDCYLIPYQFPTLNERSLQRLTSL